MRAKIIYILIIKVNKLFSLFSSWCFLEEVENMYSMFLSSYTNTCESLGELKKAVETLTCGSCCHSISHSPKQTYRPTYRSSVSRHIDRCLTDMLADISSGPSWSIYQPTLDRYVDQHIDRHSADMSVDMSTDMSAEVGVHKIHMIRQNKHTPPVITYSLSPKSRLAR